MAAGRTASALFVLALFAWWATAEGGYAPGAWYPGALLVLIALAAVARPRMWRTLPRTPRWAVAALAGYAAWCFCSIAWADARGDAWDGANRTLLYLSVFALFAVVPWTPSGAAAWLGTFALASAAIGSWPIIEAVAGGTTDAFAHGRLAGPIGYENASAALFLVAFWAAMLLAARPGAGARWRAALLPAAGLLVELTVLTQSRGSALAGIATLVLALALVPDRPALLVALCPVAVTCGAALPVLLEVYEHGAPGTQPELAGVGIAMAISAVVLIAAGAGLARAGVWATARSWPGHRGAVAGLTVLAAAVAAAVALAGGPAAAPGGAADSRFAAGADSGRYDFWRVAALEFARHPITGVGADNFAHDYVRERRRDEEPLYPHSLVLRAVAQTGVIGGGLLALFLGAVVAAVLRLRGMDRANGGVAVAAFVAAAAWVAHGSIDWLWEIPAVAAPAMACLGIAAGLGPRTTAPHNRLSVARRVAATATVVLAVLSCALPALAAAEVERAVREWNVNPSAALRGLERASSLNPLSDRPDLVAGALARRAGDRAIARRAFLAALERDERSWNAHVEVALLDLEDGRRTAALSRLEHARQLNPREPAIAAALASARRGAAPPPDLLDFLSSVAVPGPIGRKPVDCRPVLGLGRDC